MRFWLRMRHANVATLFALGWLLFIGLQIRSKTAWLIILGVMTLLSLHAWYAALRLQRTITGSPTSRIASAAQGYVEILGTGRYQRDGQLISKLSALPCLWYRYRIERNSGDDWREIDNGESSDPFMLDDGSGVCFVDPSGAEIMTRHKETWYGANLGNQDNSPADAGSKKTKYRYTEWKLIEGDDIYVLGEFKTIGGSTVTDTLDDQVKAVLQEWKLDMPALHRRFDLDGNGAIDMWEWSLARQAARREAQNRLTQARNQADLNFIVRPDGGRLFLVSNFEPDQLTRSYRLWAWAHIVMFFGALGGAAWVLNQHRF